jgi:hypothetical protein
MAKVLRELLKTIAMMSVGVVLLVGLPLVGGWYVRQHSHTQYEYLLTVQRRVFEFNQTHGRPPTRDEAQQLLPNSSPGVVLNQLRDDSMELELRGAINRFITLNYNGKFGAEHDPRD